jgi:methionyl-tRNA formyltransferase
MAAEALDLPVHHPVSLRSEEAQKIYAAHAADVAVVVAYGLILPQAILDMPRLGCLNIHASLLPRWRGAAPIHRAIMAGDTETGLCIMQMDAGLDTGPVLARQSLPIGPADTTGDLHDRLAQLGAAMITQTLADLPNLAAIPQATDGVTYATKIDKAEARIDWTRPATEIDRQIRGLSPFPGAWCLIGDERVKLLRARLAQGTGQPGQVLRGLTIACGTGAVEITLAQREGKRAMPAADFLRGVSGLTRFS